MFCHTTINLDRTTDHCHTLSRHASRRVGRKSARADLEAMRARGEFASGQWRGGKGWCDGVESRLKECKVHGDQLGQQRTQQMVGTELQQCGLGAVGGGGSRYCHQHSTCQCLLIAARQHSTHRERRKGQSVVGKLKALRLVLKFEGSSDAIIIPKPSPVVVEDQWGGRGPWWRKMG